MKRYVRAAVTRKTGDRINYEAVDNVCSILEQLANDALPEGVEVEIKDDYNSFEGDFVVNCIVADNSILTTPMGRKVRIISAGNRVKFTVLDPDSIMSEFGEIPLDNMSVYGFDSYFLSLRVSNSSYSDARVTINDWRKKDDEVPEDELGELLKARFDQFLVDLDENIDIGCKDREDELRRQAKEEQAKAARRLNKKLSQPITRSNLNQILRELRKNSDSKYTSNDRYLREVSYEDDFTAYYDIQQMIRGLNDNDIVFGDALDDPGLILDYGRIDSIGIHHSFEESDYIDDKRRLNAEYGFTRQRSS